MTKVFISGPRQLSRLNAEGKAGLTHDRERLHNPDLDLTQKQWVRGCSSPTALRRMTVIPKSRTTKGKGA
jgi:hypothetical protein